MKPIQMLSVVVALLSFCHSAAGIEFENVPEFETRNASSSADGDEFACTPLDGMTALLLSGPSFADFELSLEYKAEGPATAFVRGHELPVTPIPEDTPADELKRGIYGYAVPLTGADAGSIHDRLLRGEIAVTKGASKDGWNALKIVALGNTIVVSLNGKESARIEDYGYTAGKVGFLIEKGEFRFRNAKVEKPGRAGAWRALFNGDDLDGWVKWGTETWTVKDGIIEGTSGPDKSEGYLATEDTWSDFHVRGTFKILGDGNYGLFYHSTIAYDDKQYPIISGIQTEVAPGTPSPSGWLYESYKRGWLEAPDNTRPAAYALDEGEWNEIEALSVGNRVITWVNGIQVADFTDPTPNYDNGAFALQLHAGGAEGILWKDLFVKE